MALVFNPRKIKNKRNKTLETLWMIFSITIKDLIFSNAFITEINNPEKTQNGTIKLKTLRKIAS